MIKQSQEERIVFVFSFYLKIKHKYDSMGLLRFMFRKLRFSKHKIRRKDT